MLEFGESDIVKNQLYIIVLVLILTSAALSGCIQTDEQKPVATINVGDSVNLRSESIGSTGGTISVSKPGDALDEMQIIIPENAYSDSTEFSISYSPIVDHTLGEYFNPITPLIHVDNGRGYSEDFMTVTIPVEIPDGYFAMPFYFDETSGELEGIPIISQTNNSISFATRHFSKFTVSTVLIDLLFDDIDTGFKHGVDDWQFTNHGSYIAHDGHCSGQCVAAIYYYNELKEEKKASLYGLYDNDGNEPKTPNLQRDDELAYKLCSVIQKEQNFNSEKENRLYSKQFHDVDDKWTFLAFAYTMLKTKHPQIVGVYRYNETGKCTAGHALIAYKIELDYDTLNPLLYISDPNKPYSQEDKTERTIMYNLTTNKFEPYISSSRYGTTQYNYTNICYFGITSSIRWSVLKNYWQQLEDGTIGDGYFPEYDWEIWNNDTQEYELFNDGMETEEDKVKLRVKLKESLKTAFLQYHDEAGDGKHIGSFDDDDTIEIEIDLKMGTNKLGFYLAGNKTERMKYNYIGFDWLTIKKDIEYHGSQGARIVVFAYFDASVTGSKVYIEGKKVTPSGTTKDHMKTNAELFGTMTAYQFDYTIHDPENYILFTAGVEGGSSASKTVTYSDLIDTNEIQLSIYV